MMLTIFTPLFNRANFLNGMYDSLVLQNDANIEWVIVDDGSSDNSFVVIKGIKKQASFPIRYHSQLNKGKHFAINKGLELAKGELFLILDSDDKLPKDAVKIIKFYYNTIRDHQNIIGVAGRRNFSDGTITGNQPFNEVLSNSLDIRHTHGTTGDLVEVFKTKLLKKFPFPEIPNEKFCPEDLVWNRIAQEYKILFFNKGIYTTQYLEGGLSDKIVKIRMDSPIASMTTYSELSSYNIPFVKKIKAMINFWRFSFNSNMNFNLKRNFLKSKWTIIFLPLGYLMYMRDKKINK